MTQETAAKPMAETTSQPAPKKQVPIQDIVDSLKNVADDIGQMNELTSEEKLLVSQFFQSLLKLMQPLAPAMPVDVSALPFKAGLVDEAHVDPTGHLALLFHDKHLELKNLEEEQNRELMIAVIEDVMPKFKTLTNAQKRKIETRIKFISAVTKEIQKISDTLSNIMPNSRS